MTAGWGPNCAVRTDGSVNCWGILYGSGGQTYQIPPPPDGEYSAISPGSRHVCGARTNDSIACWGYGYEGQTAAPGGENFVSFDFGGPCFADWVHPALLPAGVLRGTSLSRYQRENTPPSALAVKMPVASWPMVPSPAGEPSGWNSCPLLKVNFLQLASATVTPAASNPTARSLAGATTIMARLLLPKARFRM